LLELDEEGHCFVTGLHKEESLLCLLSWWVWIGWGGTLFCHRTTQRRIAALSSELMSMGHGSLTWMLLSH
jgi:hypothetical protein